MQDYTDYISEGLTRLFADTQLELLLMSATEWVAVTVSTDEWGMGWTEPIMTDDGTETVLVCPSVMALWTMDLTPSELEGVLILILTLCLAYDGTSTEDRSEVRLRAARAALTETDPVGANFLFDLQAQAA